MIPILCIALLLGACSFKDESINAPAPSGKEVRDSDSQPQASSAEWLPTDGSGAGSDGDGLLPEKTSDDATSAPAQSYGEVSHGTDSKGPSEQGGSIGLQEASAGRNGVGQASAGKADEKGLSGAGAGGSSSDAASALERKIICIDPGHGNPQIAIPNEKVAPNSQQTKAGAAYGTQGVSTGIPEYKLNMEVSLKLRSALEAQGCIVVMTRESNDENLGNIERAQIGNKAGSDLVIRVHADGSENAGAHGVSVLYPGDRYISDEALLAASKSAAQCIHDAVVEATGAKARGIVKRDDLTGFNWTTRPAILIEMGFMTNPDEDKLLNDPEYQDKIVQGIVNGLLGYFASSPH